jgi:hypothetical protein
VRGAVRRVPGFYVETSMKVLFFSDAHLSEYIWATEPNICGDAFWALEQVRRFALQHEVEAVVCGGDLLDTNKPSTRVILELRKFLDGIVKHGITFAFVQGQHDYADPSWIEAVCDSDKVTNLHQTSVLIGGLWFSGINWTPRAALPDAAKRVHPSTEVLVVHQLWTELLGLKAGAFADGSLKDLFGHLEKLRLVYSGDMHETKYQQLDFFALSTGATHFRRLGEPLKGHECVVIDFDNDEMIECPFAGRHIAHASVATEEDMAMLLSDTTIQHLARSSERLAGQGAPESVRRPVVIVEAAEQYAPAFVDENCPLRSVAHVRVSIRRSEDENVSERLVYDASNSMEEFVHKIDDVIRSDYGLTGEDAEDLEKLLQVCCTRGYDEAEETLAEIREKRLRKEIEVIQGDGT